ncbi:hypothetical protein [Actinocorallia longicatena]|uniref:Uncharacterized protein n=1 Tax=Actinocorallia longicatena TaxID=111803 RepID=A0ABP6PV38_9ACTN
MQLLRTYPARRHGHSFAPAGERSIARGYLKVLGRARSAAALDAWHATGERGARPPGRLRTYEVPRVSRPTLAWAAPLYRAFYDPDGRPRSPRRSGSF